MLLLINKGDERAFQELFMAYKERLYAFAMSMLGGHDEAIDVVQETFIRIWENREKIDADNNFQSYLFQITRNLILDRIRQNALSTEFSPQVVENLTQMHASADALIDVHQIESLETEVVRAMPEQRQKIYQLSRYEQKSHKEIADMLGIDVSTVRMHIKLALRSLRDCFQAYDCIPLLFCFLLFY